MSLHGPLVMLVEDDEDDRLLVHRAFARAHLDVPILDIHHGQLAIDYLCGDGPYSDRWLHPLPSVIMLDMRLPRRSGADVLQHMAQHPTLAHIPVVLLVSSAMDIDEAEKLGAQLTLMKPVQAEPLAEMFTRIGAPPPGGEQAAWVSWPA